MDGHAVRRAAERYLSAADLLCSLHPDRDAVRAAAVPDLPPAAAFGPAGQALHAALRYVRDEVLAVQAGRVTGVGVLADEIAHARRVLADMADRPAVGDADCRCRRFVH